MSRLDRLIFGVISDSMMAKSAVGRGEDFQPIPQAMDGQPTTLPQCAVMVQMGGRDNTTVHVIPSKTATPKQIKTLLINELAMTLQDLESIQQAEIPRNSFYLLKIAMGSEHAMLSLLPSLQCAAAVLPKEISVKSNFFYFNENNDENAAIWSIKRKADQTFDPRQYFQCSGALTYQEFLIRFCRHECGSTLCCQIEFELYIFLYPLLFGKASCSPRGQKELTFFFARTLSCADMCHLFDFTEG